MRVTATALALTCAVVTSATSAATAVAADGRSPLRPAGSVRPLGDERLSDEQRLSRVAGAVTRTPVRTSPTTKAKTIAGLHFRTEDGPLETYMTLESHRDAAGRTWIRIRLPGRPNGRTGWVPRSALGSFQVIRTMLRVNRSTLRATLYRSGRPIWTSRIGVGKASTPTPAGRFWIRSRLRGTGGDSPYGPFAFGTSAYSVLSEWPGGGVIGVHGTNEPQLLPGRPSHGCIRVPNGAVTRLWKLLPVGTPVRIL